MNDLSYRYKKGDKVKLIGNEYLNLKDKILVIDTCFPLGGKPTYKVYLKDESWRMYIFYEDVLKITRGKLK